MNSNSRTPMLIILTVVFRALTVKIAMQLQDQLKWTGKNLLSLL